MTSSLTVSEPFSYKGKDKVKAKQRENKIIGEGKFERKPLIPLVTVTTPPKGLMKEGC